MSATRKATSKPPTQLVGNVGLYYACYRLSLLGWNVMPTARNARGIDILCYSQDGQRTVTVQVKALSMRNPVPLGHGLDNLVAQWIVIVRHASAEYPKRPESFVLNKPEIERGVHISKDGKRTHWLQPRDYEAEEFKEAWARIGHGFEEQER